MKTSMRPDSSVQKLLISSPSRVVGEFENDFLLVTHAWPDGLASKFMSRHEEGPASRNAYVVAFKTEPYDPKKAENRDYSAVGPMLCAYFGVLFGKRFDLHGMIEENGFFGLPNLLQYISLSKHTFSFHSHEPRVCVDIPLNWRQVSKLTPLLTGEVKDKSVIKTFQFASRFYSQALQVYEENPEIAYLHLVTAGEILSNAFKFKDEELHDKYTLGALNRIEENLSDGKVIAKRFRKSLLAIRRRFVRALVLLLNDSFYVTHETREEWMSLKKDSIVRSIGAAYDLRSKYVHSGEQFGVWVSSAQGWEVHVGRPVVENKEYAKILQRAPTFFGLERVIRYALLRYLQCGGLEIHSCLQSDKAVPPSVGGEDV